jgi:hypothetical protein
MRQQTGQTKKHHGIKCSRLNRKEFNFWICAQEASKLLELLDLAVACR